MGKPEFENQELVVLDSIAVGLSGLLGGAIVSEQLEERPDFPLSQVQAQSLVELRRNLPEICRTTGELKYQVEERASLLASVDDTSEWRCAPTEAGFILTDANTSFKSGEVTWSLADTKTGFVFQSPRGFLDAKWIIDPQQQVSAL